MRTPSSAKGRQRPVQPLRSRRSPRGTDELPRHAEAMLLTLHGGRPGGVNLEERCLISIESAQRGNRIIILRRSLTTAGAGTNSCAQMHSPKHRKVPRPGDHAAGTDLGLPTGLPLFCGRESVSESRLVAAKPFQNSQQVLMESIQSGSPACMAQNQTENGAVPPVWHRKTQAYLGNLCTGA